MSDITVDPGGGREGWASTPGRRRNMQANRSRDTTPELAVRRLLHAAGLRYRVHTRPVPALRRTADVVFTRARIAVFIDGCYWHACPKHSHPPATNADYWAPKLMANVTRDADTNAALQASGWLVLRYWEHENPADVAKQIAYAYSARLGDVGTPAVRGLADEETGGSERGG